MKKIYDLKFKIHEQRGFTLIELLIVIVIIGILSSFLLANFIGVRQRARDSQRKSDLRQIQSALELYRADQGVYPISINGNLLIGVCDPLSPISLKDPNKTVTYMQKIPCDPLKTDSPFQGGSYYYNSSDGLAYTLVACLENANDGDPNVKPKDYPFPASPASNSCATVFYVLNNP